MRVGSTEVDALRRYALQASPVYSLVDRRCLKPTNLTCRFRKVHRRCNTRCSSSSSLSPGENGPAVDNTPLDLDNLRSSRGASNAFEAKDARIHPTSVKTVHPDAVLGEGVEVGPFCIIGPSVVLGANTRLLGHNCIAGKVR